jgi:hypothetical protein
MTSTNESRIWSVQMESVRKDIECCYGILKVRFKILAYPIQFHSGKHKGKFVRDFSFTLFHFISFFNVCEMQDYVRKINNTVWACCVLHNLLLSYDGNLCFYFIFISFDVFCDLTSTGLDKLWTEDDYLSCW